jgi:hypothetical protein
MYLRITKQLTSADAARLRSVKAGEESLRNIKDFKFLTDGIKLKNIFDEKHPWYEMLASKKVFKCYGTFTLPEYRLIEWANMLGYCERKARNRIWRRSFNLSLGDTPSALGDLSLHARIFQDYYDAEEYTLHLAEGAKSNIFSIASYFYNKKAFYNKIHAFLGKNKSKFETLMGEEFIHQLTALFSVDKSPKTVKAYNLALSEKYESFEQTPPLLAKTAYLPLCFSRIFSLKNKYGITIELDYFLGTDNTLVIETNTAFAKTKFFSASIKAIPAKTWEKNKSFTATLYEAFMKKFLAEQLNDCLTGMEKIIDFGFDIYEVVKTNLLIDNI